jgi:hypothetical protein
MAPITADDNVRFLLKCIICKEGDKVGAQTASLREVIVNTEQIDFDKVATECGIVTKAAA